ncbi:hypothetical protein Baya_4885 [Bagarius yarrelli]|uniref:Uncharacterized protein n=1 Tax=Bagarius yarrelli TaxID=175774 RepID=A0A556TRU7_BAGYA|nr:hypothetical protein Baya_4885 [Bagarius yarrelli]
MNEFGGLKKVKAKRFTAGVSSRVSLQALLCQTSGGGSTRSTVCEAHFPTESMHNLERKWYNRESTGEPWKLNKERECKQPAPVLQCKQSLCKVKSTAQMEA